MLLATIRAEKHSHKTTLVGALVTHIHTRRTQKHARAHVPTHTFPYVPTHIRSHAHVPTHVHTYIHSHRQTQKETERNTERNTERDRKKHTRMHNRSVCKYYTIENWYNDNVIINSVGQTKHWVISANNPLHQCKHSLGPCTPQG